MMVSYDLDNFVERLADFMIERAGAFTPPLSLSRSTAPRDIWTHQAYEGVIGGVQQSAEVYSVLLRYDGGLPQAVPVPWCSIQVTTVGAQLKATLTRAGDLYRTLIDDQGHPLQMADIGGGFRINGMELSAPAAIGVDDKQRHEVVFNIRNCSFVKTA